MKEQIKHWTTHDPRCLPMTRDEVFQHKRIAFDLDGTLVNGMRSLEIRRFIRETVRQPGRDYIIITHRCADRDTSRILRDIETGKFPLQHWMFSQIITMPIPACLTETQHFPSPIPPALDIALRAHKGMQAAKHGATLLIDDDPATSFECAELFGVRFLHSNDFPVA